MRFIAIISIVLVVVSCERTDPGPVVTDQSQAILAGTGFFIINEGNFTRGNGSLSFLSIDSSKIYNNIFLAANGRSTGDIPFSMQIEGDTGYLVVNNSGKIEMIDLTTAKAIRTLTGLISPRYIESVRQGTSYLSSLYSDSVAIIDTDKLTIKGYINLGRKSEMIIAAGIKVYIASWSGDSAITVIDARNDMIIKTIMVTLEPESMALDSNGILWVLCSGGYMKDETPALISIDTATDRIVSEFFFPKSSYPTSLKIDYSGDTLYYTDNGIYKMSVLENELPSEPLIQADNRIFYRVVSDLQNGDILVTDANDYQRKGFLLRYDAAGNLKQSWESGIIPGHIVFNEIKD